MNGWRRAGERCRRIRDQTAIDTAILFAATASLVFVCLFVWIQHLTQNPYIPALLTAATVILTIAFVFRFRRAKNRASKNNRGAKGEGRTAHYLEKMNGHVFSNVPCEHGDIDHVFISKKGLFVLETKNWEHDAHISFDGEKLTFPNGMKTTKPVDQIRKNAAWLYNLFKKSGLNTPLVHPALILLDKTVTTTIKDPPVFAGDINEFGTWHNARSDCLSTGQQEKIAQVISRL